MKRSTALFLALPLSLLLLGAAPPEIIRVRVPADRVGACFPKGTDFEVLRPDQFESLVERVRIESDRRRPFVPPRILRAQHHARWNSGVLHGKSVLTLQGGKAERPMLPLAPWTPAIRGNLQIGKVLGLNATGQAGLWVDPANSTISFEWELVARPESRGRGFTLGLPGDAASTLVLDLPKGWSPIGPDGVRVGPLKIGSDPGRSGWEFAGSSGLIDLRIQDPQDPDAVTPGGRLWVHGKTRIDLRGPLLRGEGIGNWSTEWVVESDRQGPTSLTAELDLGLELISVSGPGVDQFQQSRTTSGTRVIVTFSNAMKMPAKLTFSGHADVPLEGIWNVPALRPADAIWTGGTTTIALDEKRVVSDCRERGGRRIASAPIADGRSSLLAFESSSPASVAELVLRKPRVELACVVIGQLNLGQSAPSLECRLKWTMPRGSPPELAFDLPPTWIPDRVQLMGLNDALVWHSSIRGDGGTRVTVLVPSGIGDGHELTLILGATSTIPGGRGNMDFPRIRPVKSEIIDECWAARIDSSLRLEPISARGIAWVDPFLVTTFDPSSGFPDLTSNETRRVALAWRWIEENAAVRAARESVDSGSVASVLTQAKLSRDGKSLILDGRIVCKTSEPLKTLPIWLPLTDARPSDWQFTLDAPNAAGQRRLELTPIDRVAHAELGFPPEGVAWKVLLPQDAKDGTDIHFHAQLGWTGRGTVPLLSLPKSHVPRSLISVEIPREFLARMATDRLRDLNPSAIDQSVEASGIVPRPSREARPSEAPILRTFSYSDPSAKLELSTEQMAARGTAPIVRDATLATAIDVSGQLLNRLRLLVQSEGRELVDFSMPDDSVLVRILVDGVAVDTIRQEASYSIPLPALNPGASTTIISIDYLQTHKPFGTSTRLRPQFPRFKLPCLSFTWEVLKPPGWEALNQSPGLSASSEDWSVRWPFGSLGLNGSARLVREERDTPLSAEQIRWLEEKLRNPQEESLTLAECFTRWDSGQLPVVVDRIALMSSGLGPRSLLRTPRGEAVGTNNGLRSLRELGISLVALDRGLLITSQGGTSDIPSTRLRREAMLQAIAWGADRADRFQSVRRWRGEASPRVSSEGEADSVLRPSPGWTVSRFAFADWPSETAVIEINDRQTQLAWGFWIGLLIATLFLAFGSRSSRKESIGLALLLISCTALAIGTPDRYEPLYAGGFLASLAVLVVRCVQPRRSRVLSTLPALDRQSSLVKPPAYTAVALLALGLMIPSNTGWGAPNGEEKSEPIVAVIPYEGNFDPAKRPDRVILRLSDFRQLERWARPTVVPELTPVRATSVVHRVFRATRQEAVVETEFELLVDGTQPATFDMMVSGTHRISATLDGVESAVLIRPNGRQASVTVEGAGAHRLTVKRSVTLQREAAVSRLLLPVDRFPSAKIEIPPSRETASSPLLAVASHGTLSVQSDRRTIGLLGPVDQLDITWKETQHAGVDRSSLNVDGLLLWDIEPAGDRIRARFTYHGVQRLSTVRFKIDPALIPRSIQCPGFVDVRREQRETESLWAVHIDPPLTNHATIGLEFWRPTVPERTTPKAGAIFPFGPDTHRRSLAQLEPVDVERYSGALGVRRPGNWTGRLAPLRGAEPITDETFVKLWGDLPSEPLTLSGITRFVGTPPIELRTGPAVERVRVRPAAEFQIGSGRIDVNYEADFAESLGNFHQAVLALPAKFRVMSIDAEGLTDWSVASDHRLHLRFDRPAPTRRKLRIRGWAPIDEKPLESGTKRLRAPTPWIHWLDVDVEPGPVSIGASSKPTIEGGDGLKLVSEGSDPASLTDSRFRLDCRVDDPSALGEITWELIPPRLTVSIDSQAIVHRDWAEWTAILRYDVIGGALSTLNLNLPSEWAADARILLPGNPAQITKVTRDITTYSINPERPIWGSQQLILRAEKAIAPQPDFQFPEIMPLGRGVTDTYLNLVSSTGEPFRLVNSAGLQVVGDIGRFRKAGFNTTFKDPNASANYHVQKDKWQLSLQLPRASTGPSPDKERAARASFADINITETSDRSMIGEACYDIVPGGGWFLPIEMPTGTEVIRATVDHASVTPFQTASGRWMIPIESRETRTVRILWRRLPGQTSKAPFAFEVNLPKAGPEPVSTILRFNTSKTLVPETEGRLNGLQQTSPDRQELIRTGSIVKRINELLGSFDRGSFRDREQLVSLLITLELSLRDSARTATPRKDAPKLPATGAGADPSLATIASIRNTVAESIRRAGLAEIAESAQAYLGQIPADSPRPTVGPLDSSRQPRIREIGTPTFYAGIAPGLQQPDGNPQFSLKTLPQVSLSPAASFAEAGLLFIPIGFSIVLIFPRFRDSTGWRRLLCTTSLLAWVGWVGGGFTLIAFLLMVCGFGGLRTWIGRIES